jgi:hypothetical protein
MAALTSVQSGNFTASATWGGTTPADGDTFTISAGHSVTSSTINMPTNGYGDITIHGCWSMQSGSQFKLNGRATVRGGESQVFTEGVSDSAGLLEMKDNTELVIKGTNSEQHRIWVENETRASIICDGSEKTLNTVISCSGYIDYNQDYLPVVSASNFAAGDWISVYSRFQGYKNCSDESFIVHDTDTTAGLNKIYYRQFVSPSAIIRGFLSPRIIDVDNSKVFRVGYKIIFGTGSDRNVVSIIGIDFNRNRIRIDANVTGTLSNLIGETIYQTGNEKQHTNGYGRSVNTESGSIVRRNATTLTTAITSADSTNQIVVGNASDLSVGDEIIIDVNNDTDTNWDYDTKYTITAKSLDNTTLTLDDQVRYVHKVGSLVNVLTRDCVIRSEDADDRVYLYVENWQTFAGGAGTRRVRFRNVQFKGLGGNTNNNFYRAGVAIAGYNGGLDPNDSSNEQYFFQSETTNCTFDGSAINYNSTYHGFLFRNNWGHHGRNNVSYAGSRNFYVHGYGAHGQYMGNYSTRARDHGFILDNNTEVYAEASYNYITRADDYGAIFYHARENVQRRHWVFLNHENRPFQQTYAIPNQLYDRWYLDGFRHWPYIPAASGPVIFLDSYIRNRWDATAPDGTGQVYSNYISMAQSARVEWDRTTAVCGVVTYQEYNHEIDALAMQQGQCLKEWVNDGGYWKVKFGNDTAAGVMDTVYVPPKTTVRLSCEIQSVGTDGSFAYPRLSARMSGDYKRGRYALGEYDTTSLTSTNRPKMSKSVGFLENVAYDNGSIGAFQEKQLTIQPQDVGYYLLYGVTVNNTNTREEHFFIKEPIVRFDKSTGAEVRLHRNTDRKVVQRSNFTTIKKRISGRI